MAKKKAKIKVKNLKQELTFNTAHVCVCITAHNCRTVHNTGQHSSDNLPSYPPHNHHYSNVAYWS